MNSPNFIRFRIARPVTSLQKTIPFYKTGIGLIEIDRFQNHNGYNGVMLGLPDLTHHLEFREHSDHILPSEISPEDLLVFYYPNSNERETVVNRLLQLGYRTEKAINPYWNQFGILFIDPDHRNVILALLPSS